MRDVLEALRSRTELGPRERANAAAARATRAWLLGKCLADEVDDLRVDNEGGRVPAPGLARLLLRLEHDVEDVCDMSDRVLALLASPDQSEELEARIEVEADAAERGAEESERGARRIAQLACGVSSAVGSSERAQRLEHAAVAVLHPPPGAGALVGLVDDGVEFFSRRTRGLRIELRGVVRRMLVDHNVAVRIGRMELRVGTDETFHLSTPEGDRTWNSPVYVGAPARVIAKALTKAELSVEEIRTPVVAEWVTR